MNETLGILRKPPQLAELKEGQMVTALLFPKQLGGGAPAENQYRQYMRVGGKLLSWAAKDMSKVDFSEVFPSTVTVNDIPAGAADYDKFLVSHAGKIEYRTAAQIQADLGLAIEGEAHAIPDHADVAIAEPANLDVLQYNGSNWVDRSLAEAGISAVGHLHDDRYYTETEIDDALLVYYTGTPTAGHIPYYTDANTIAMDENQLFWDAANNRLGVGTSSPDGLFHTAKSATYNYNYFDTYSDSNEYSYLLLRRSDSDTIGTKLETDSGETLGILGWQGVDNTPAFDYGAYIAVAQVGAAGVKVPTKMSFVTYSSTVANIGMVLDETGRVGIGTSSPNKLLTLADQGDAGSKTFTSGWAGTGWYLDWLSAHKYHLELESMTIRGPLNVYELIINSIHSVDGGMIISKGHARVASVSETHPNETIVIEDPSSHGASPFKKGDIVMVQRIAVDDTSVVRKEQRQVKENYVSGLTMTLEATAGGVDTANIQAGDVLVVLGNIEGADGTTGRDASIFLSASETNNPFIRIRDNIHSVGHWNNAANVVTAIGNLNGSFGYVTDVYGIAAGRYISYEGYQYFSVDPTNGLRIMQYRGSGWKTMLVASADLLQVGHTADKFKYVPSTNVLTVAGWTINVSDIEKFSGEPSVGIRMSATDKRITAGDLDGERVEIDGTGIIRFYDSATNLNTLRAVSTNLEINRLKVGWLDVTVLQLPTGAPGAPVDGSCYWTGGASLRWHIYDGVGSAWKSVQLGGHDIINKLSDLQDLNVSEAKEGQVLRKSATGWEAADVTKELHARIVDLETEVATLKQQLAMA